MTSGSTSSSSPANADNRSAAGAESKANEASNVHDASFIFDGQNAARKTTSVISDRAVLHGSELGEVPVTVTAAQSALVQLEEHCYGVLDAEIGGVLLGKVDRKGSSSTIIVQAVLPVKTDDYGPVHFTFTADSWALLHKERAEQYPTLDIVGWYHTHPGLGVFYSADDVVVHSAAFVMPWHVGLVIDPVYKEGCWFGWQSKEVGEQESGLAAIGGYYELLAKSEDSVVSWKLVDASIWETGYTPKPPSYLSDQVYVPANEWPALPPISPWWGVLLGGISLVLIILLLLDRLLTLVN